MSNSTNQYPGTTINDQEGGNHHQGRSNHQLQGDSYQGMTNHQPQGNVYPSYHHQQNNHQSKSDQVPSHSCQCPPTHHVLNAWCVSSNATDRGAT
ncbi:MAG: hypothetical protein ACK56F_08135, partial [bacterium]